MSPSLSLGLSLYVSPSKTGGPAWLEPKKKTFSVLSGGHVVKGLGSERLMAVGAVCVRASFVAVEIECGE